MPSGNHEAAARCSKLSSQLNLQHLTWSSLHAAHDHHYKLSGADHPVQIIQCRSSSADYQFCELLHDDHLELIIWCCSSLLRAF